MRALESEAAATQLEKWADAVSGRDSGEPEPPADANMQNALSITVLFTATVSHFLADLRTVRRVDIESFTAALRAQGKAEEAASYERQAALAANTPYIVTRQRTDARIEAFFKGMGTLTKSMFGSYLDGVLATLTNVAFEDDRWDQQRVRALLRR